MVAFGQRGRRIRIFSELATTGFHFESGKRPQESLCPESFINMPCCSACVSGKQKATRYIVLAWDIDHKKWVSCILSAGDLLEMRCHYKDSGCTSQEFTTGNGPDMIVQGWGNALEIVSMPETVGLPRGDGNVPNLVDYCTNLAKKSKLCIIKQKKGDKINGKHTDRNLVTRQDE